MIAIGEYTVWSVSLDPDDEDTVIVTLKRTGCPDVKLDMHISQYPAVGSTIRLGWM